MILKTFDKLFNGFCSIECAWEYRTDPFWEEDVPGGGELRDFWNEINFGSTEMEIESRIRHLRSTGAIIPNTRLGLL
jgi:hypothetical protein